MNALPIRSRLASILVLACLAVICLPTLASASYTISPSSHNFGNVTVGLVSGSTSFTVTNTGTTSITVTSFALAPSQFIFFAGWAPKTLLAGQKTTFDVKFVPTAAQLYNGTFTIYVDSVPTVITLTGTGKVTKAKAGLSVTSLDLGSNPAGQTSLPQTVTVTNTGTASMTLNSIVVDPPFAVTGFNGATVLAAGASLPLQVTSRGTSPGTSKSVLVFNYSVLPSNGVALSSTTTTPVALAVTTFPTLPLATANSAYLATLLAGGGTSPYSFALSNGAALPLGLILSSAGTISGTLDPSVAVGTYNFTVQVTDSSVKQNTATLAMTLQVFAPTGANCNNITWNTGQTHKPGVPLNDLGTGSYLGQQGGLYPGGSNVRPATHDSDGASIAAGIQPLDANGNVDPANGKIGILSIGMSDTFDVFLTFMTDATADPTKSPAVTFVPGAQPRASATMFADPNNAVWNPIMQNFLPQAGLTANQVIIGWVNDGNTTTGTFPSNMQQTQANLESIAQNLHTKFPNMKLAYYGSRFYAGYSNGLVNPANPEPYAYQTGFAVKWTIQDQLNGLASLNYNPANGPVMAPWIDWGQYDWANGLLARSDGLVWTCQDLESDGTHPSSAHGREKDSNMLLYFFKTDDTTTPWFLAH
jgi:hypothetical protein